jgi:hypothetical protein
LEIMNVSTNNTEEEMWRYLSLFSQEKFARENISDSHPKLTRKKLNEICLRISSCINQAKEYYEASKSVSILTKPLLLYYGMYSLAKALIYFRDPQINVDSLRHHGLLAPKIDDKVERFLSATTELHSKGVFSHFSKYTQNNRCVIPVSETEVDYVNLIDLPIEWNLRKLVDGEKLVLRDILLSLPELFDVFLLMGRKRFRLYKITLELEKNISGNWKRLLNVYKTGNDGLTINLLQKKIPEIRGEWERTKDTEDTIVFDRHLHGSYETLIPKKLVQSTSGGYFLASGENPISDANCNFIAMFFLSNIVRYKPPLWRRILDSKYRIMIEKFVSSSESKFPKLVLDELFEKMIIFKED